MTEEVVSKAIDEIKNADEETLKKIIEQHFEAVRIQGMKLGAQYISMAIFDVIRKHTKKVAKTSLNDYKRMTADIIKIISVQLTQQNDLEENEVAGETNNDGTAE